LLEAPAPPALGGLRDRAILELLYASGLRVSELAGLNEADVDFDQQMVRVLGKGNKERIVPYGAYAARAIEAYRRERARTLPGRPDRRGEVPLWVNLRGGRLTARSIERLLARQRV